MDPAHRFQRKWIIPGIAVCSMAACDHGLAPDPAPPCPPDCILTVDSIRDVEIARSVTVSARVTNLRDNPVSGIVVDWSVGLRLPCFRGCLLTVPYAHLVDIAPSTSVTGADGRVVGTVVIPAEGNYTLTARIEPDQSVQREFVASYPTGASWQVEWTSRRPMPVPFQGSAAAQIGSRVIVMEGVCGSTLNPGACMGRDFSPGSRYTDIYNIQTDSWQLGAQPPAVPGWGQGLKNGSENLPAAAPLNGAVHLVRGLAHHVYDPATDLWTERTSPPEPGPQARLEATGGRLFLIGTGQERRGVHTYDPITDAWAAATPMPSGRGGMASAVVNGLIYVAGGLLGPMTADRLSTVERYDPATDSWESLPPMPLPRSHLAAGAVGHRFCVFGGGLPSAQAGRGFQETYCYDTAAGSWSLGPRMPWSQVILVAAAGDGQNIFVFGGGNHTHVGDMWQVADAARLSAR